jgi:hypothetical protein
VLHRRNRGGSHTRAAGQATAALIDGPTRFSSIALSNDALFVIDLDGMDEGLRIWLRRKGGVDNSGRRFYWIPKVKNKEEWLSPV